MQLPRGATRAAFTLASLAGATLSGQIRVHPTGVNVNTQGATTVLLTFGGVNGYEAVEAFWCGELIPAPPAVGLRCAPGTIFGRLPVRYARAIASGVNAMTDIMTIPPSVSRRAYQAAVSGSPSAFFYVRRFRSLSGGQPDQFVAVTCRLAGGGARTPLSLTDVRVAFSPETPILHVAQGEPLPKLAATISYTGSGRLVGRWEIVRPGEDLPTIEDLLTEATLPLEDRGLQRRYMQVERFNVFLPPTGRIVLEGPHSNRLPTTVDGAYHILLRIETSLDKEGDSNLGSVGAGPGIVPSGAVAGFPMPVLRYIVGSGEVNDSDIRSGSETIRLLAPRSAATFDSTTPATFTWQTTLDAAFHTIEIETRDGEAVHSAVLPGNLAFYRAPPWLASRATSRALRWRIIALDTGGRRIARSAWREITAQ